MKSILINYSHHVVHYICMTHLFYNWNFVHFDLLHEFHPPPTLLLATTNLFSISMSPSFSQTFHGTVLQSYGSALHSFPSNTSLFLSHILAIFTVNFNNFLVFAQNMSLFIVYSTQNLIKEEGGKSIG